MEKEKIANQKAYTIPYNWYMNHDVLEEETTNIFSDSWLMVGHISQVKYVGDYFTCEIAGKSVIICRNQNEELSAFYNMCPHRGTKVEKGTSGNKHMFQCSYHGWTFQLNGSLNRAPNFKGCDLEGRDCLFPVQVDELQSLIFINLNSNAMPLTSVYHKLDEELQTYSFLNSLTEVRVNERIVEANWKAIIDNYLECDHCPIAHPSFSKQFDMKNYNIVTEDYFSYQYSTMKNESSEKQAKFYWIWPNVMVSIYPGSQNMTTSQILPLTAERSLAIYRYYFQSPSLTSDDEALINFVDQVREEDFELVELMQKGFSTQAFTCGIYSPSEHAIKHFHSLVKHHMAK